MKMGYRVFAVIFHLGIIFLMLPGTSTTNPHAVVELLVVCDMTFSAKFDHNREKIYEFWATQIWDANLRFRSLASVPNRITIRVVNMILIQRLDQDHSLFKGINTKDVFIKKLGNRFADWLYEREHMLGSFDAAILASGVQYFYRPGWDTLGATVCQKFGYQILEGNSGVIFYNVQDMTFTTNLAALLGAFLGATLDFETDCIHDNTHVLGSRHFGIERFFFSTCSSDDIGNFLHKKESQCVFKHSIKANDVLVNYSHIAPPTFHEQCKRATQIKSAYAATSNDACVVAKCYATKRNEPEHILDITPTDNTPCGRHSNCFRGRCLPRGYQIQSFISHKCLNSFRFKSNGNLLAKDCRDAPNPLETHRVEDWGGQGKRLVTPYSKKYSTNTLDKCLTVQDKGYISGTPETKYKLTAVYQSCSENADEYWNLIRANSTEDNFLLLHRSTNSCIVFEEDEIAVSSLCNPNDKKFLWIFFGDKRNITAPVNMLESVSGLTFFSESESGHHARKGLYWWMGFKTGFVGGALLASAFMLLAL